MQGIKRIDETAFIGRDIGTVTIVRELGRGNMGIVFIAFQKSLRRQVAVKVLPKSVVVNEEARQQFLDEAEIIAGLSHPNIIPIFEMGETTDFYYQVMQLVTGSDLKAIIRDRLKHPVSIRRLLPLYQTIDLMAQVLDGLDYAHHEGIIHQDIKPANILVEQRGMRPLIADFGIAKTAQTEYKEVDTIVGTPLYLSPEHARGLETDARSDIYSAGVVLFEMLAGKLPLHSESIEEVFRRKLQAPDTVFALKPHDASPLINEELEAILLRAMAGNPVNRYQSCAAFRADLLRFRDKYVPRPPQGQEPPA
jgi:eukaryotic-like serine/threonine-protein kinase